MDDKVVEETRNWISKVVVGCNFCPFAARELKRGSIRYSILRTEDLKTILEKLADELAKLDINPEIETTLIILPESFENFELYLDMIGLCEDLVSELDYEGIYQIASFHPEYVFAGASADDPSNYTNRSVYPMIHILREASITKVLENIAHPEDIPRNNIRYTKEKGLAYMQVLKNSCYL